MKVIDEREKQQKSKDRKQQRGDADNSESVRAKWFCCAFKFGYLQTLSEFYQ